MLKKGFLLLAALLFAVCAHLRPVYACVLSDGTVAPRCGVWDCFLGERAAREAAEEILRGGAVSPVVSKRLAFSFRKPAGDARQLSDALLRATTGAARRDEVRVNGQLLGWVEDGEALKEALGSYIQNTRPAWASGGVLNGDLTIRRLYTRAAHLTAQRDMLLLITGAAPVFYYDQTGRYARA